MIQARNPVEKANFGSKYCNELVAFEKGNFDRPPMDRQFTKVKTVKFHLKFFLLFFNVENSFFFLYKL